jgi:outer membrane protein
MQSHLPKKVRLPYLLVFLFLILFRPGYGQDSATPQDSTLQVATLEKVVQYALNHQPAVLQAQIDQKITDKAIRGKLADWYPQVNFAYNYQRFIDLQTSVIGGNEITFGVENTSYLQLNATQTLFNRDVLLASSTAHQVRLQSSQNAARSKINMAVNVSKAFYDLLATFQQIKVSQESIVRLERSLKTAQNQYNAGLTDRTDYKRATILLNNAKASLKSNTEVLVYKDAYLKTLMGYPLGSELPIQYDTLQMEQEIVMDTLESMNVTQNIDYKVLFTQRQLQEANYKYAKWAFLPSANAFGFYNLNYQNNAFSELYKNNFPYSYVGATLTLPIFQGGKRIAKIQEQRWTNRRMDLDLTNLSNTLNTEYTRAMASYKSNLANYQALKENVELAQEVYDVINLQYKNGVKAYLDVTIAETDLRTSRINYFNALYQVLASKLDVQRALGKINY